MALPHTVSTGKSPTPTTVLRGTGRRDRTWFSICATIFVIAWGGNQFTPLLTMYRAQRGFSELAVNTLLFAYVVGLIPSLLHAHRLAERWGPRAPLVLAVPASALGSILVAAGSHNPALMFAGRMSTGMALGIGMVVGGLALDSLTTTPGRAPRASAMSLTSGFATGAGTAGVLAQWAPAPTTAAYVLHVILCAAGAVLIVRFAPKTARTPAVRSGTARTRIPLPAAFHLLVIPAAPWIFGALGIAYAVLPSIVASQLDGFTTAFSGLLCLLSLGLGFFAQRLVGTTAGRTGPARVTGVALVVTGMLAAACAAATEVLWLAVVAASVLGIGYGLTLVGCLRDCERLAPPGRLGTMTGRVYCLGYLGFGLPTAIAWLHSSFTIGTTAILLCVAAVAVVSNAGGAAVLRFVRRVHPG
ncbi:MFS transporter [Rhodococcus sp. WB9]|uniref:MFS transporter n=1 Tax=Rhodococcus sp. WB9 TaxID=2594007 RepID=UPI0016423973|nr:MFS transporter [Rhodococcus sp. WB9]